MATKTSSSPRDAGEVTLEDVARVAGVSSSTASRALNGSTRRVRPELRARVIAAADRLGYRPDLSAQVIARRVSLTIAVVVDDLTDPYSSAVTAGLVRGVRDDGLSAFVVERPESSEGATDQIRMLRGQRLRAIVIVASQGAAAVDDAVGHELREVVAHGGRVIVAEVADGVDRDLEAHGRSISRAAVRTGSPQLSARPDDTSGRR